MKLAFVLSVLVVVACAEENPARHLGDAGVDTVGDVELVVAKTGTGSGTVASTPAGISCGDNCKASFAQGSKVTLIAEASADSEFAGWSGACEGAVAACEVSLDAAANVTATFTLKSYTVTLTKAGAGTGKINGGGQECTGSCTLTVDHGTALSFSATPTNLSVFAGWGGACTNSTGACAVTVTSDLNISASFVLDNFTLVVAPSGSGTGTVTSNPAGITCGNTCSKTFTANQMVTLSASPATSSTFMGWSGGGCSGTGTCTVTIDGAKTVTATFTLKTYTLTVSKSGMGTVTSNVNGISCGQTCSATYNHGASITLSATAMSGYTFSGFSGSCNGATCTLSMTANRTVTATFTPTYTLTVDNTGGDGAGTVTGGSINCGGACTQTSVSGTQVTLTATPSAANATLSTFAGWSGACSGFGTCTVTLTGNVSVTANWKLEPNIMFVTSIVKNGSLGGIDGADAICKELAGSSGLAGTYLAYLSYRRSPTTVINAPDRFAGASGWVRVDGKPVVNTIEQFHKGQVSNAPRIMETGDDVFGTQMQYVWTGTSTDGTYIPNGVCEVQGAPSWSTNDPQGYFGNALATNFNVVFQDGTGCFVERRLYCFGIDRAANVQ